VTTTLSCMIYSPYIGNCYDQPAYQMHDVKFLSSSTTKIRKETHDVDIGSDLRWLVVIQGHRYHNHSIERIRLPIKL